VNFGGRGETSWRIGGEFFSVRSPPGNQHRAVPKIGFFTARTNSFVKALGGPGPPQTFSAGSDGVRRGYFDSGGGDFGGLRFGGLAWMWKKPPAVYRFYLIFFHGKKRIGVLGFQKNKALVAHGGFRVDPGQEVRRPPHLKRGKRFFSLRDWAPRGGEGGVIREKKKKTAFTPGAGGRGTPGGLKGVKQIQGRAEQNLLAARLSVIGGGPGGPAWARPEASLIVPQAFLVQLLKYRRNFRFFCPDRGAVAVSCVPRFFRVGRPPFCEIPETGRLGEKSLSAHPNPHQRG